jgi:hypothetical protein
MLLDVAHLLLPPLAVHAERLGAARMLASPLSSATIQLRDSGDLPVWRTCGYHRGVGGEMKGMSLRNYPHVLEELRGVGARSRMMEFLPEELAESVRSATILSNAWYPVTWKCALHEAGRRATGEAGLARMMGAEMTRRDLQGVYRVFVRIVSPRYVMSVGARLFSSYLRPGTMRVDEVRKGFTRVSFAGCKDFSYDLWQDVAGGCEASLQVAGAANLRLRIVSGCRDGDENGVMQAWWTPGATDELDPEVERDIANAESMQPVDPQRRDARQLR